MLSAIKLLPRATRMLRILLATTSICMILTFIVLSLSIISAASASPSTGSSSTTANNNNSNQTQLQSIQASSSVGTTSSTKSGDAKSTNNNSKTNGNGQQVTIVEQQQEQPTDLQSMYVQIPIAEPVDTGVQDGVQQTLSGESSDNSGQSDSSKGGSTWTGPWPKKFQIGYIKQSDLHQVLIESLKNDPFASLGSPSASSKPVATSTSSPVVVSNNKGSVSTKTVGGDSSLHMQSPQKPPVQWSTSGTSYVGNQQIQRPQHHQQIQGPHLQPQLQPVIMQNYRESKLIQQQPFQQQMHRFPQMNYNNQHAMRPFNQQTQKLIPMTNNGFQQQQQFQFAGFPSNLFKNQPMYTINNFPAHYDQLDSNSMQLLMGPHQQQQQQQVAQQQQFAAAPPTSSSGGPLAAPPPTLVATRPQKSAEYYSSWRPVTSDKSEQQTSPVVAPSSKTSNNAATAPTGQSQPTDYQNINDGFDDGFNSPSKDAINTGSMNRHPMLNNYLGTDNSATSAAANGKMSPAMISAMKMKQQQEGNSKTPTAGATKSTAATKGSAPPSVDSGSIKSSTSPAQAGKGGAQDSTSGMNLSVNRRRSQTNATSTTSTTTTTATSDNAQSTTTTATTNDDRTTQTSTTISPLQSTTSASATAVTTTTVDSETTEPDSEVIDSETTEPSVMSTTTGSSGSTASTTATSDSSTVATTSSTVAPAQMSQAGGGGGDSMQSTNQQDNGESEVVTQGNVMQQSSGTANFPGLTPGGNQNSSSSTQTTPRGNSVTTTTTTTTGSTREETTPNSSGEGNTSDETKGEVEGSVEKKTPDGDNKLDSMSDEAILAATIRTGSEIGKTMNLQRERQRSSTQVSNKKARSSERLVQPTSGQSTNSGSRKSGANKLITKKPSSSTSRRSAKQVNQGIKGGSGSAKLNQQREGSGKSANNKKRNGGKSGSKSSAATKSSKSTRMAAQQSAKLQQQKPQQQPQVVSMSAAQAQSTAQTLASLLLSRCMSSTNCAHLLDICSTKQAAIPLSSMISSSTSAGESAAVDGSSSALSSTGSNQSSGWSMPVGLMSSSIMSLTQALQADRVLKVFPQWQETIENIVDQDTQTGYTLILPSNEAIERLPLATLDSWLANSELMAQVIDNHIIDSSESIDFSSPSGKTPSQQTRVIRSKGLQVNQHRDKMVTINGKRLVYANQAAPSNGRIHVIDGVLDWPASSGSTQTKLLDIMDTLKQCDKFDGFVTLAEGTGLTQILKQDGPMTVFVPSNEALRKIPDDELEVIKNNSTALKEFIMYHVVNGSYFSQDLRDGQQLASILDMKPIQVGVRVDGCSRRLVEANTSPMRRPDIVAKNGVIHILDWYLTVRDNEWCDGLGRSTTSSSAANPTTSSANVAANTSERLQQLASDSAATYATRMTMPANHKPAMVVAPPLPTQLNEGAAVIGGSSNDQSAIPKVASSSIGSGGLETNNIIVSATPLNDHSTDSVSLIA